jgi:hypothetical protein
MGTTLANVGPQAGMAAQGFMQGREARTREDMSRQSIALRAAEEGRAKEQHRFSIQQLGLQIQGMQQAQDQAAQMFPPQLAQAQRGTSPVSPDVRGGLNQIPGVKIPEGDVWTPEAFDMAQMGAQGYRAEQANRLGYARVQAGETPVEKPLEALKVLETKLQRAESALLNAQAKLNGVRRLSDAERAVTESDIEALRYKLIPAARRAVAEFRAQHPELGAPQASLNELDQDN